MLDPHHRTFDRPSSSSVVEKKFSLTMAYSTLTKPCKSKVNLDWLWRGTIPPKLKIFLWLLCWDHLPTSTLLHHCNIIPLALCPMCHSHEESTTHVIRECTLATDVWSITLFLSLQNHTFEEWMAQYLNPPLMIGASPWAISSPSFVGRSGPNESNTCSKTPQYPA